MSLELVEFEIDVRESCGCCVFFVADKLDQVLDMQMTTLSDMQVGDLVIEIDLQVRRGAAFISLSFLL